jgi:hypothetical protein
MAKRHKAEPADYTKAIAAGVTGALGGVGTGAAAGAVVAPWLAKSAFLVAYFDPTFVTPVVFGMIGAAAMGYHKYKESIAERKRGKK